MTKKPIPLVNGELFDTILLAFGVHFPNEIRV